MIKNILDKNKAILSAINVDDVSSKRDSSGN